MALAEAVTCRRRVLLGYFGETLGKRLRQLDVCTDPPARFDATVDAQAFHASTAWSSASASNTSSTCCAVPIPSASAACATTGCRPMASAATKSEQEGHRIIRQLIHHGYLEQDIANYSVLTLTPTARPLLKGELRLDWPNHASSLSATRRNGPGADANGPYDETLFDELRRLRKALADAEGKPPYIVFGDATLVQMARDKPRPNRTCWRSAASGQHKLDKYGDDFLNAIAEYCVASGERGGALAPALRDTWQLCQQGLTWMRSPVECGQTLAETVAQLLAD